jgi:hypothetical protein
LDEKTADLYNKHGLAAFPRNSTDDATASCGGERVEAAENSYAQLMAAHATLVACGTLLLSAAPVSSIEKELAGANGENKTGATTGTRKPDAAATGKRGSKKSNKKTPQQQPPLAAFTRALGHMAAQRI